MELLDIHTHHLPSSPEIAILDCMLGRGDLPHNVLYCSAGIHPWELTADNVTQKWKSLLSLIRDLPVVAIGEAGLDKLINCPLSLQLEVFKRQIELADKLQKPLIIHCVRSANEVIALRKELQPHNPWIIHGFRGKKELALEYIRHGFYLSFGENYQEESLRVVPLNKIFLETDESLIDISLLYERAAKILLIPVEAFKEQIQLNIEKVFFNG